MSASLEQWRREAHRRHNATLFRGGDLTAAQCPVCQDTGYCRKRLRSSRAYIQRCWNCRYGRKRPAWDDGDLRSGKNRNSETKPS